MVLSLVTFLPTVFALILMLTRSDKMVRLLALIFGWSEFFISAAILTKFKTGTPSLQLVERYAWISDFGITYFLGVDGLSLWLVLLTTFLTPIIILGSWTSIRERVKGFHISLFILETAMLGTFLAMDSVLFYLFWELSLIPMYFMVGIWGGPRRIYATVKFFIFTMLGSVFMLLAIIYMIYQTADVAGYYSASILDFYNLSLPFVAGEFLTPQTLCFLAFSIAFAIKVPLFPLHTWLPDAHVEAPTPGSVILAGVMLKMGTYGFLRFSIPMFPEAVQNWGWIFLIAATVGIIYGALVAMVQPDMKKLVAYSSVSHMGYVLLGLFALNIEGMAGALFQMLNHGVSTGALFLLVGMIYERTHSREIKRYGGLAANLPLFAIFFFIITLSSIAVPMTNGFIGEYLILLGSFLSGEIFVYFAILGVVLGAVYMLWMYKNVFFGTDGEIVKHHKLEDMNMREICVMIPLVVLVFWMGIKPNHFLDWSKSSLDHLVQNQKGYQLTVDLDTKSQDVVQKSDHDSIVGHQTSYDSSRSYEAER